MHLYRFVVIYVVVGAIIFDSSKILSFHIHIHCQQRKKFKNKISPVRFFLKKRSYVLLVLATHTFCQDNESLDKRMGWKNGTNNKNSDIANMQNEHAFPSICIRIRSFNGISTRLFQCFVQCISWKEAESVERYVWTEWWHGVKLLKEITQEPTKNDGKRIQLAYFWTISVVYRLQSMHT